VARWGCASNNLFSADTKLFLGIGDGAAANWGSESFSDRLGVGGSSVSGTSTDVNHPLVVTIGTSAAARVIVDRAVLCGANGQAATAVPTGLFCYVLNTKHLLVGGALTDAGSIVEWCSNLMLGGDESRLHQCMADLGTEADGTVVPNPDNVPVVLPFWTAGAGERSPGYHAQAVGTISYVNKRTTARQILQAAVEGVSFRLLEIISLVRSATAGVGGGCTEPGPIVGSGGALDASPYWRKLLAILTGSSVVQSNSRENGEATSRGVARYMWEHLLSAPGGSSSGRPTSTASPERTDCVGGDGVPLDDTVTDQTTSIAFREQLAQRKLRHDMLYHTMLETWSDFSIYPACCIPQWCKIVYDFENVYVHTVNILEHFQSGCSYRNRNWAYA
jgi:sugar (pentulose or hexulose) kinase